MLFSEEVVQAGIVPVFHVLFNLADVLRSVGSDISLFLPVAYVISHGSQYAENCYQSYKYGEDGDPDSPFVETGGLFKDVFLGLLIVPGKTLHLLLVKFGIWIRFPAVGTEFIFYIQIASAVFAFH